jgi:hypothetical protein
MSQDGQGHGPGEQPGPPSWSPEEPAVWSPPTEHAAQPADGVGAAPYGAPAAPQYQPYQPYAGPAPTYRQGDPWSGRSTPGPVPPGYGPPGFSPAVGPPQTPAIAVVGLVLAIIMAPVGLVVSLVALGRTRRAGAGRGLAVAGALIGGVLLVAGIGLGVALGPKLVDLAMPRSTVLRFTAAIENGSCDDFMAATTQALQSDGGIATCADFDAAMAGNGYRDNHVVVTGVSVEDGVASVSTIETYLWLEDGQTYTDRFVYRVVKEDGAWRVDAVDPADQ